MSSYKSAAAALAALSIMTITSVQAQDALGAAAPAGVRDPGDPKAAVPPARYASAFERYRANAEVEVGRWRDLNDNVGRIGGWRTYGKEATADTKGGDGPTTERKRDVGAASGQAPHGHKH